MYRILFLFLCFGIMNLNTFDLEAAEAGTTKMYAKEYYENGQLKAEGWEMGTMKMGYWKFYHTNGVIASEGHFRKNNRHAYWHFYNTDGMVIKEGHYSNGSAENWWIFYDIANQRTSKFQYKDNKKNGFCLQYKKRKLWRAEKYTNDKKVGEWTSIFAFKRDNPGVSF